MILLGSIFLQCELRDGYAKRSVNDEQHFVKVIQTKQKALISSLVLCLRGSFGCLSHSSDC